MLLSRNLIAIGLLFICFAAVAEAEEGYYQAMPPSVEQIFNSNNGNLWKPYTEWTVKPGNSRVLGDGLLMIPLWQDSNSLIFTELRVQADDASSYEGNWGLGFRTITDSDVILGAYGFYDSRRTRNNNSFNQATFGLEALTVNWEARINGYIPEDTPKAVAGGGGGAFFQGGTIFVQSGVERAYYGFDAEVGALLNDWNNGDWEMRGFAGGFQFNNKAAGFPSIAGPRLRLELRGYNIDLIGEGSRLTFGTEYQWDQVRGDQVYGMLQVRIPLGRSRRKLSRLQRRMMDRIVRDIDVVSGQSPSGQEIAKDPTTGQLLTNVTIIDAETVDVQTTIAGAGGIVIADGSKGTIDVNASIFTQANQTLFGGGLEVTGSNSNNTTTFGTRPTFINSNAAVDTIVVANGASVRGVNVNGGRHGIATTNDGNDTLATDSLISNNNVTGAAGNGFTLNNEIHGTVNNNTATNNIGNGFELGSIHTTGTVAENIATGNTEHGFGIDTVIGDVTNNTATNNGQSGFYGSHIVSGGTFNGNAATENGVYGIRLGDISGTVNNNTTTSNTDDGFRFGIVDANGVFTNNTSISNGRDGIGDIITPLANGFAFSSNSGTFTGNSSLFNANNGFASSYNNLFNQDAGTFTGNIANTNGNFGFLGNNNGGTVNTNSVGTGGTNTNGNNTFP